MVCCTILLICVATGFSGEKLSYFSGIWMLDKDLSEGVNNQLFMGSISIELKGDSLTTIRNYETEWGESYPVKETLSLDGREYSQTAHGLPRKVSGKPSADGKSLILNVYVRWNGDSGPIDINTVETWNIDQDKTVLTLEFESSWSGGENQGMRYYNKSE